MLAALQEALLIGTHRIEDSNKSTCTLKWHLGRLRGTKLESCDFQLSITKKHHWPGIRPDRRKDCNIASKLVTVYIFPRLVTATYAAEAHLLMSNEPTTLLDHFQAFRLDFKCLRSCHTVSHTSSNFPIAGGMGYLLIS